MVTRSGVSPIVSVVLYTSIIVAAIGMVLQIGIPMIDRMQDTAAIENSMDVLDELDDAIQTVASEGKRAARDLTVTFDRGQYRFDDTANEIYYQLETDSPIISSHASRTIGPVRLEADTGVDVVESEVNGVDCYMMSNDHLEVCVRKLSDGFDPTHHPNATAFWLMDEGEGQWVNDSTDNSNNGFRGGSTSASGDDPNWTSDAVHGSALDFDGDNDFVNTTVSELNPPLTISAWVNIDNENADQTLISNEDGNSDELGIRIQDGDVIWVHDYGGVRLSSGQVKNDNWEHLAMTINGTNLTAYQNGSAIDTVSDTNTTVIDGTIFKIGTQGDGSTDPLNGKVDDVRIYNRSLSSEEIRWIYEEEADLGHIDTEELILHVNNTHTDQDLNYTLTTEINNLTNSSFGTGFTQPENLAERIGRGRVSADVHSEAGPNYTLRIDLRTGSDFLTMEPDNIATTGTTQNVSLQMDAEFDHPHDTVVIDDEKNPAEDTYSSSALDFGYAALENSGDLAALVPGGEFIQLSYQNLSSSFRFTQFQEPADSIFLAPFTDGTHQDIENRERNMAGTIFGPGNFLTRPRPSFAYDLTDEKTVRASLGYDDIDLRGFDRRLSQGTHTISVNNSGVEDGNVVVHLDVQ